MKLYRTPTGHWAGTKDDAAFLAKTHNTTYQQCDVPYDKPGLLAFLNDFQVGAETPAQSEPQVEVVKELVTDANPLRTAQLKRLELEEAIWEAPLEVAVALAEIVMNRIREFARKA